MGTTDNFASFWHTNRCLFFFCIDVIGAAIYTGVYYSEPRSCEARLPPLSNKSITRNNEVRVIMWCTDVIVANKFEYSCTARARYVTRKLAITAVGTPISPDLEATI